MHSSLGSAAETQKNSTANIVLLETKANWKLLATKSTKLFDLCSTVIQSLAFSWIIFVVAQQTIAGAYLSKQKYKLVRL